MSGSHLTMSSPEASPAPFWTGLVLASGQSSRMGTNKALLPWGEHTLHEHMKRTLEQAGAGKVLVNLPEEKGGDLVDSYPGRGPLSGIHAALKACRKSCLVAVPVLVVPVLVVVPVDMPLLKPEHITRLVEGFYQEGKGKHPVQFDGYSLPLLLPVNEESLAAAEQAITSDNRRHYALWRLFEKLGGIALPPPADHQVSFANTNTQEEWQAALALQ